MYDLNTFLDYCENVRARTLRVADCIPEDHMEWVPGEGRWSCGDILRHLAGIERAVRRCDGLGDAWGGANGVIET